MIIVMKPGASEEDLDRVRERVEGLGLRTQINRGTTRTVVGCLGDEDLLRNLPLMALSGVESVLPVMKPYKLASREFSQENTRIPFGKTEIGGSHIPVIAGPCSVEGEEMLRETAAGVRDAGGAGVRGGAFKPRSSPWSFQGLGVQALELLRQTREETGLPVVTEVMDTRQVELVAAHADVLQVGARNMQNFSLLSELGRIQRPILLKRGLSGTLQELILAAEHIMKQGNQQVILCERGIRTFETATRNTFDVASFPVLKRETHLPVVADPSHGGGRRDLVLPLSLAAVAAGADGILVEVHPDPEKALSDGDQSLPLSGFAGFMRALEPVATAVGRRIRN